MQMQSDVVVAGAFPSKGDFNGKAFDSTKVHVELRLAKGERSKGIATVEYVWGLSTNYDKIEHLDFPFKAKGIFEQVSNGREVRTILIDLIPEKAPVVGQK